MKKSSLSRIALACLFGAILAAGCKFGFLEDSDDTPAVQAPVDEALVIPGASPQGGSYTEGYKRITLSTSTPDALIYYTDNGTAPTLESNRYNEPIDIYGSKTIKAVAVKGGKISQVMTATYTLNSGREANKLGIVKGRVALPEDNKTLMSDVSIYSDDIPGVINHPDDSGFFIFDGLDTSKRYTFYFTNQEVGVIREKDRSVVSAARNTTGIGGQPIVARKVTNVEPALGAGINLLDILLKQTGSISGTVNLYNRAGTLETDHGGVDVYVPGTSYTAKTDSAGNFTLQFLPEGLYNIRASKPDYTFREITDLTVAANTVTPAGTEPIKITYGYGTVTGYVSLFGLPDGGGTYENVLVVLSNTADSTFSVSASSVMDGSYTLSNVEPGLYTLILSKDEFEPYIINEISVESSKTTVIPSATLLAKGGSISGSVSISGETNLGSTIIVATNAFGRTYSTATNSTGVFTLNPVAQGVYSITASRVGFTSQTITGVEISAGKNLTDLVIPQLVSTRGTINGTVLLQGATRHEGTSVTLRKSDDSTVSKTATTDADGAYIFSDVKPGTYLVLFAHDGYASGNGTTVLLSGEGVQTAPSVTLQSSKARLGGTATLSGATDFAGISILVSSGTVNWSTVTNSEGIWSIGVLEAGIYSITASHSGYLPKKVLDITLREGQSLSDISMGALKLSIGSINGTVLLEGSLTFEGTAVTLRKSDDPAVSKSATTDANGSYIFSDVKPGTYLVTFARDGYLSGSGTQVTLAADGIASAESVTLLSGKARLGGTATLESASDHSGISILASAGEKTYNTVTDATGRWMIVAMDPGTYTVQATRDGYTASRSDPVVLGAGAVHDTVVQNLAVSSRSLVGTVTLEGRSVYSGTKVTATNLENPSLIYSALTNDQGRFVLAGMIPGGYILSYSRENYRGITTNEISLATTSSVTLDPVEMTRATGTVSGIVKKEGRSAHAGIAVTLLGTEFTTTTDADGVYSFTVPSANYPGGVRFECEDFETAADTETITVLTDSAYGVQTHTIRATHNSVSGQVDLLGTDDDAGIAVTIDGTEISTNTAVEGVWSLAHLPMGSYTVRFSKLNTPDVTTNITIGASDPVQLGRLEMIPNASGLKGWIKLDGMNDHSGIRVTVTTEGQPDLTATTNASGAFQIGNILSPGSHTVTASKAGWNSWSRTISDFEPLEVRSIGGLLDVISLTDTTAPSFGSSGMTLNGGTQFSSDSVLRVSVNLVEKGSGPDKIQLQLNGFPAEPDWEPYNGVFNCDLSSFYTYSDNGSYTLSIRVKDKAGNISSWTSASITVTDQLTTLSGPLSDADLLWTKAKSPYCVVGNVRVGVGKTLVIEPGVEVKFTGDYHIESYGIVTALGTEALPVVFSKADGFTGSWTKTFNIMADAPLASADADGTWIEGSRFEYVSFKDVQNPITSGTNGQWYFVADSSLKFGECSSSGILVRCDITNALPNGTVTIIDSTIHDLYLAIIFSGTIKNSSISSIWAPTSFSGTFTNVLVDTAHRIGFGGTLNGVTVRNAETLSLSGTITASRFENISQTVHFDSMETTVTSSAFLNNGSLLSDVSWSPSSPSINLRGNYFGSAATEEMNAQGTATNKSFTYDYWDDIYKAELDVSGYLISIPANVGFQGEGYVAPDVRSTMANNMVHVFGGSSSSITNGTANGTWSVSDFSISQYEVTQAQYVVIMGENPSSFKGDLNRPVVNVSWYDVVEFCNKLSAITGKTPAYTYAGYGTDPAAWPAGWKDVYNNNNISCDWTASGYRLPTEAEWEWAARGGNQSLGYTYAGSNTEGDVAWYTGNSSNTTHAVGTKASNELGLYDMSGNVWEWCWDWDGASMTGTDPVGAASGTYRVARGGCWMYDADYLRVAYHGSHYPDYRGNLFGFRLVLPAVQE